LQLAQQRQQVLALHRMSLQCLGQNSQRKSTAAGQRPRAR
jgi:hypothetical protein